MTFRAQCSRAVSAALVWIGAGALLAVERAPVSDFQQPLADGVVVAGTLHADAFDRLAAGTRVIDLRSVEEGAAAAVAEAAAAAAAAGIDYHNVPVPGAAIDPDQVEEVARLIDQAGGGPVLLHCASGNRAGMIWGAVQLRRGMDLDQVRERLVGVPLRPAAEDALSEFAAACATAAEPCPATVPMP